MLNTLYLSRLNAFKCWGILKMGKVSVSKGAKMPEQEFEKYSEIAKEVVKEKSKK